MSSSLSFRRETDLHDAAAASVILSTTTAPTHRRARLHPLYSYRTVPYRTVLVSYCAAPSVFLRDDPKTPKPSTRSSSSPSASQVTPRDAQTTAAQCYRKYSTKHRSRRSRLRAESGAHGGPRDVRQAKLIDAAVLRAHRRAGDRSVHTTLENHPNRPVQRDTTGHKQLAASRLTATHRNSPQHSPTQYKQASKHNTTQK